MEQTGDTNIGGAPFRLPTSYPTRTQSNATHQPLAPLSDALFRPLGVNIGVHTGNVGNVRIESPPVQLWTVLNGSNEPNLMDFFSMMVSYLKTYFHMCRKFVLILHYSLYFCFHLLL